MPLPTTTQAPVRETVMFVIDPSAAPEGEKPEALPKQNATTISTAHTVGSIVAAFLIVAGTALVLRLVEAKIQSPKSSVSEAVPHSRIDIANFASGCKKIFKVAGSYVWIPSANAATVPYAAKFFIESKERVTVTAGEEATYIVGFKNTGSREWRNDGNNYISVYSAKPYYRKSTFAAPNWEKNVKPGRLKDARVAPGAIGYFEITLKAPEVPGEYTEWFSLAREGIVWMPGGSFSIPITVTEKPAYSAMLLLKSDKELVLRQGEETSVTVGWKNSGNTPWKVKSIVSKGLEMASDASANPSIFASSAWPSSNEAARVNGDAVLPGQIGFVDFSIRAPERPGRFVIRFALVADGNDVLGGDVEFVGNVTDDSDVRALPSVEPLGMTSEPDLRVGLCYIPYDAGDSGQTGIDPCVSSGSAALRVSSAVSLSLQNGNNETVASNVGGSVEVRFDPTTRFTVTSGGATYSFYDAVRIVPQSKSDIVVFDTWKNLIASGENDNRQRGTLEFRYLADKQRIWAINELPLELYVKGLAEIPFNWPIEAQKAQAIAARTYAAYYFLAGGKHASQEHILNAGEGDQVYHGVGAELRRPTLSRAVDETRGVVITYNGGVVSTPYFAQSDGRTRSWAEVYGSPARPWLQSVDAPYDLGKTRRGHGIGMSQMDAYGRAKSGTSYEDILKHYYSGIELKRAY